MCNDDPILKGYLGAFFLRYHLTEWVSLIAKVALRNHEYIFYIPKCIKILYLQQRKELDNFTRRTILFDNLYL